MPFGPNLLVYCPCMGIQASAPGSSGRKEVREGDSLMVDIHAMFKLGLGDHAHNYFIGEATDRQRWHAVNFVDIVMRTLKAYRAGITPVALAQEMMDTEERPSERSFRDLLYDVVFTNTHGRLLIER